MFLLNFRYSFRISWLVPKDFNSQAFFNLARVGCFTGRLKISYFGSINNFVRVIWMISNFELRIIILPISSLLGVVQSPIKSIDFFTNLIDSLSSVLINILLDICSRLAILISIFESVKNCFGISLSCSNLCRKRCWMKIFFRLSPKCLMLVIYYESNEPRNFFIYSSCWVNKSRTKKYDERR